LERDADLIRERLRDLNLNSKKRSKQLSYRLSYVSVPQVHRVH